MMGGAGYPIYTSSNSGINGMTRSLAMELAPHRVRVNAVCPGASMTEGAIDLVFHERRFILRRSGERPAEGVEVERYELDPPGGSGTALDIEVEPVARWSDFLRRRNSERIRDSGA